MLTEILNRDLLKNSLRPADSWHPFPRAADRICWESLPGTARSALTACGDRALAAKWPGLPASLFLEFDRTGNRRNYEQPRSERRKILMDLVLAYCSVFDRKYLDPVIDALWSICEESYWGVPAHLNIQKSGTGLPDTEEPTVDLFAAETAALLGWCHYLLKTDIDGISPLISPRIIREIRTRVLTPCLERDFWWMGFGSRKLNNWNPWINSNLLTCILLLENDEENRLNHIEKIIRSIDMFIKAYPEDGGCDEGPSYWGKAAASLFDALELLYSASDGAIDIYKEPLIASMGRFIYRLHIHDKWFVNFADAAAICVPDPGIIYQYGVRINDSDMQGFGAYLAGINGMAAGTLHGELGRRLRSVFLIETLAGISPRQPLPKDVWLPDTQIMIARRDKGSCSGPFIAVKGGHNGESHNHNDVGQFIIFSEGKPLIVDPGVGEYRRKTFSSERYDIWTMQSEYHNLPVFNGLGQSPGPEFCAGEISCRTGPGSAEISMDISSAYPAGAGLKSMIRTVTLHRDRGVELVDEWELEGDSFSVCLHLMTPCSVEQPRDGLLVLAKRRLPQGRSSAGGSVSLNTRSFHIIIEEIPIKDSRLGPVWGDALSRIVMKTLEPEMTGSYTLLFERQPPQP